MLHLEENRYLFQSLLKNAWMTLQTPWWIHHWLISSKHNFFRCYCIWERNWTLNSTVRVLYLWSKNDSAMAVGASLAQNGWFAITERNMYFALCQKNLQENFSSFVSWNWCASSSCNKAIIPTYKEVHNKMDGEKHIHCFRMTKSKSGCKTHPNNMVGPEREVHSKVPSSNLPLRNGPEIF